MLFILFTLTGSLFGQSTIKTRKTFGQITGRIWEQKTGEPLIGVNVFVQGTPFGAITDSTGYFIIGRIPPGDYAIVASIIGYQLKTVDSVVVAAEKITQVDFKLQERVIPLKEVIVTPGHFALMEIGPRSSSGLGAEDLRNFPQFGEDIYRAAARLPGLASNDFSAKFYVRGGEQDEVLILLDGMELFDPFHLKDFGGAISVIDVELIREIDMLSGAFPAEYGNRLSGVFNMTTRTPDSEKPKTSLALSFMNARLLSEGSFNQGQCRWQVLARRGYVDYILDLIGEGDSYQPHFYDVSAKLQYLLNQNHEVSVHVLTSSDKFEGSENDLPDPANAENIHNQYGNRHAWVTWNAQLHSKLFAQSVAFIGSAFDDRLSQGYYNEILEYEASDEHEYWFTGLKQNWTYDINDWCLLKWGFDVKNYHAVYDYYYKSIKSDQINEYNRRDKDIKTDGTEFALYLANRFRLSALLTAEAGLRYQSATWTGDKNWNPRLNLAYKVDMRTTVRAGWGIFSQTHPIDKLSLADDDYTFYPAEKSEHFMTGLEHEFVDGINLRVEGYFKKLSNIRPRFISYRYNTDTSPENSHDRLRLAPDGGQSKGVEVYLRKDNWGLFKWWLSYAYSLVDNEIDGRNVPREMDQRHTINLDCSYQPNQKWACNISWQYHTGWPYTEETVHIIARNPNGSYNWDWAPGELYGKRFPDYHRMDIRISRNFETKKGRIALFLEVRNLYDRKNIRQYDYPLNEVIIESIDSYTYNKVPREWLPRVPSFGISWEF